jgi:SAM-dependent methyltransferase
MKELFNDKEAKELAEQLRCPTGEKGDEVGALMEETNSSMIKATTSLLNLKENSSILEIGPGNGHHLQDLLNGQRQFHLVDISQLMIDRIKENYSEQIASKQIFPILSDGEIINIKDGIIDIGFTVNTLYFWKNPKKYLTEIAQCFKAKGEFFITFAHKRFIEKLPFVQYGFELYDEEKFEELCHDSPFSIAQLTLKKEIVKIKTGEEIEREFVIAKLIKK